ncbi:MAG: T9SS type A sorting domain-containing protein [Bacteroidota bacterium]
MSCVFLLVSCNRFTTKSSKKLSSDETLPGYYGQWLYMKTNGTNVLPDISKYNWMPSTIKRSTSNALLSVEEIGPKNVGGRVRGAVVDIANPNRLIAGGATGGIFISENNGASWKPTNDQQINPSVTGMDQNPFKPEIMYYCTGEGTGNSADIMGAGVFKSTDGGLNFTQLRATKNVNFEFCWSIKCSPLDSHVLYVATNSTGLWKSINDGDTFVKVYPTATEVNDLEVLPDGSVLFTIKGNGIFRSPNGNAGTFAKVASISSTSTARSELAYCKNFPNVVYAAVSGPDNSYNGKLSQFYKSSDGGKTFKTRTNPDGTINFGFTWYALTMAVKDNDSNSIFLASLDCGYSTNGGASWSQANDIHADHHMAINMPGNKLMVGTDGGICTYNWSDFSNYTSLNNSLNVTQFYQGSVSPHKKDVMGGTQDNGTQEGQYENPTFTRINGSDGGYAFYHKQLSNVKYVSTQNGFVYRKTNGVNTLISSNLPSSTDLKWFIHPYTVSYYNGDHIVYPAGPNVYFSGNKGATFKKIGNITTGRLFASDLSEHENPVVISGGNNCLIVIDSATNTTPKVYNHFAKLPYAIRISFLGCAKFIPGSRDQAYLAYNNISDSGRVYKVTNLLSTTPVFKNISGNLPKGLPVNWIECDPTKPEMTLFAGTDFGLYVTEDGGVTWIKDTRIPNVVVSNIKIQNNKKEIYFFTHGRGIFKGLINNGVVVPVNQLSTDNNLLNIYPMPATDAMTISIDKNLIGAHYTLYNLLGSKLKDGVLDSESTAITTEALAAGNYILVIRKGEKSLSRTIAINR